MSEEIDKIMRDGRKISRVIYPSEQLDRLMHEYEMWFVPDKKELKRHEQHGLSAFELGEMHRHYLARSVDANSLSAFLDLTSISLPSEFPMEFDAPSYYWTNGRFDFLNGNPRIVVAGFRIKGESVPNEGSFLGGRVLSKRVECLDLEKDLAGIGIKIDYNLREGARLKTKPVYLER